jgi:serine/threonine protein phosphatase PrpC
VIKWKSTSHSPVGYLVESGTIAEEEAMQHDERHYVSNLVGTREMHIEIGPPITLSPRDTILVATDGLFDNLQLDEVLELARRGKPIQRAMSLIELARKRMLGSDSKIGKPDDLAMIIRTP